MVILSIIFNRCLKTYLAFRQLLLVIKTTPFAAFLTIATRCLAPVGRPFCLQSLKKDAVTILKNYLRELKRRWRCRIVARIKSDYRQTMGDLVHDNFTVGWTNWAHSRKAMTENQSHGSPANVLDLYATVDIPEIETFGGGEFPHSRVSPR
jgi:hypothetical protein